MFHKFMDVNSQELHRFYANRKRARSDSAGADSGHPVSVRRDA